MKKRLLLAWVPVMFLSACASGDWQRVTDQLAADIDDNAANAIGHLGRPLPGQMRPGAFSDPAARVRLDELCLRDGGVHVVQRVKLRAGEQVSYRATSTALARQPGVSEPVGVFNGRYELWQTVQLERAGQSTIRRMESTLRDAHTGKDVAIAVNYRVLQGTALTDMDPHCGDATLAGLSRQAFER